MTDLYGKAPTSIGNFQLRCPEFMHYQYLPVKMAGDSEIRLPPNLHWLQPLVEATFPYVSIWDYLYVTAKRRYATPGNPLNRPGWHTDGFGTNDMNWLWTDRWGTRFAVHEFINIPDDHEGSMKAFEEQAHTETTATPNHLYRLDPYVVHNTPIIPDPGGERTFVKLSRSRHKYNLEGNSHNHLFTYHWVMHDRKAIRNNPTYANSDHGPQ